MKTGTCIIKLSWKMYLAQNYKHFSTKLIWELYILTAYFLSLDCQKQSYAVSVLKQNKLLFIYWKTLQKTRFDLCTDCHNIQTSKQIKPRKTTRMQIMSTVKNPSNPINSTRYSLFTHINKVFNLTPQINH